MNMALCCGAIWRHRKKQQYRCTTTVPLVHNCHNNMLENLLPIWLLVRTNFVPNHFWTTFTKFDNYYCSGAIYRQAEIFYRLYRYTSPFRTVKYCGGFFILKYRSYLYTNFCADFWTFRNFRPQFRKDCGAN